MTCYILLMFDINSINVERGLHQEDRQDTEGTKHAKEGYQLQGLAGS